MAIKSAGSKRARLFARTTDKEDGRYCGSQIGIVTTNDQDEYFVSYIEAGFRSDHIVEPLVRRGQSIVNPQSVDHPLDYDRDLVDELDLDDKAGPREVEKAAA